MYSASRKALNFELLFFEEDVFVIFIDIILVSVFDREVFVSVLGFDFKLTLCFSRLSC